MKKRKLPTLTAKEAKTKARQLREFGFDVAYGKRGKTSAQHKAAVARAWNKVKNFVENKKQDFVFQAAEGEELEAVSRGLSSKQIMPGGFFLRKPRGAKKVPKYKLQEDGTIEYKAQGPKGGRVIEEIHPIDPELLAEDPPRAIQALASKAARRGAKIKLTVNGWDSTTTRNYDLDALAFYIATDLLPKFLDPNVADDLDEQNNNPRGTYNKLHNKARVTRTIEDFVDTFHIVISKHEKPAKRKGRNRR